MLNLRFFTRFLKLFNCTIFHDDDIQYKVDSIRLRSVAGDNELCFKDVISEKNCDTR